MEAVTAGRLDELREMVDRLAPAFDILPDAVRVVSLDGCVVYVNRAFLQMTGYSPTEVMNKTVQETYVEEDHERVKMALASLFKTGQWTGTMELRLRRKGTAADPIVVSLNCAALRNVKGDLIGGFAIFRDVSRIERILAEPMELLNLTGSPVEVMRQMPARVATYFPGRPWVMVNLVEGEYLRFAYAVNVPAELMAQGGEPLEGSICGIAIKAGRFLGISDMAADERTRQDPCVTQHGCRGYLGYPIIDSAGAVLGTICILRPTRAGFGEYDHRVLQMFAKRTAIEIERMRLETKIQETEKDLWGLVENAPIMIWRIEPNGKIRMISKKGREELGYKAHEEIRESWYDLVHPDDLPGIKSKIETAGESSASNGLFSTPIRLRKRDGTFSHFFTTVRPVRDFSGKVKMLEGITLQIPFEEN